MTLDDYDRLEELDRQISSMRRGLKATHEIRDGLRHSMTMHLMDETVITDPGGAIANWWDIPQSTWEGWIVAVRDHKAEVRYGQDETRHLCADIDGYAFRVPIGKAS